MMLQQRPATVKIDKLIAKITFDVYLEDLDNIYRNGFIFVERKE